jgi:hypothetical protein
MSYKQHAQSILLLLQGVLLMCVFQATQPLFPQSPPPLQHPSELWSTLQHRSTCRLDVATANAPAFKASTSLSPSQWEGGTSSSRTTRASRAARII